MKVIFLGQPWISIICRRHLVWITTEILLLLNHAGKLCKISIIEVLKILFLLNEPSVFEGIFQVCGYLFRRLVILTCHEVAIERYVSLMIFCLLQDGRPSLVRLTALPLLNLFVRLHLFGCLNAHDRLIIDGLHLLELLNRCAHFMHLALHVWVKALSCALDSWQIVGKLVCSIGTTYSITLVIKDLTLARRGQMRKILLWTVLRLLNCSRSISTLFHLDWHRYTSLKLCLTVFEECTCALRLVDIGARFLIRHNCGVVGWLQWRACRLSIPIVVIRSAPFLCRKVVLTVRWLRGFLLGDRCGYVGRRIWTLVSGGWMSFHGTCTYRLHMLRDRRVDSLFIIHLLVRLIRLWSHKVLHIFAVSFS